MRLISSIRKYLRDFGNKKFTGNEIINCLLWIAVGYNSAILCWKVWIALRNELARARLTRIEKQKSDVKDAIREGDVSTALDLLIQLLQHKGVAFDNFQSKELLSGYLRPAFENNMVEIFPHLLEIVTRRAEFGEYSDRVNVKEALCLACEFGHLDVLREILKRESFAHCIPLGDLNSLDDRYDDLRWKPLDIACEFGQVDVVRELLLLRRNESLFRHPDEIWKLKRDNFLFRACTNGHIDVVQVLINHGFVDVNQKVSDETAFMVAASEGHSDIMALLLLMGADPSIETPRSSIYRPFSARDFASFHGVLYEYEAAFSTHANYNARLSCGRGLLSELIVPTLAAIDSRFQSVSSIETNSFDMEDESPLRDFPIEGSSDIMSIVVGYLDTHNFLGLDPAPPINPLSDPNIPPLAERLESATLKNWSYIMQRHPKYDSSLMIRYLRGFWYTIRGWAYV